MKHPTIREDLLCDGYSQEEKYFYELNRDLIQQQHIQFEQIRRNQDLMKCPRCGFPLKATDAEGLTQAKKSRRLIDGLKKLFKPKDHYQWV